MKPAIIALAAGLVVGLAGAGFADDLKMEPRFTSTGVAFELKGAYRNVTLTIVGPNEFYARAYSTSGAPSIDLSRLGAVEDGTYTYELTAATDAVIKSKHKVDNGRDPRAAEPRVGVSASGTFAVRGGAIVKPAAAVAPKNEHDRQDRQ